MSELFDKSIRTLELPRVLQLLSEQAVSPEAKELALAVRPETDYGTCCACWIRPTAHGP